MSQEKPATDDLKHVLDAARAALDREFQRAERFDAKARGQATLAGSWFAVTQAVVAVGLRSETPRWWVAAVLAVLLLQGVALVMHLTACAKVWRLQGREDIGPATIAAMHGSVGDEDFGKRAIDLYCKILRGARAANRRRADALEGVDETGDEAAEEATTGSKLGGARTWWWAVLGLGLAEMTLVVVSRVV